MSEEGVYFDIDMLKMAPYFERLARCELYLQASDGRYHRPINGWPLDYAYGKAA